MRAVSPVFLLQFFVGFLFELGQKLLQQLFGSISVFECTALVGKVECGTLTGMKDKLKLNFGFTVWTDLLTCTDHKYSLRNPTNNTLKASLCNLMKPSTHSEYQHTSG